MTDSFDGVPDAARPSRRGRRLGLVGVVVLLVAGASISWWGRYLDFFRVHQVEVRGTRFARQSDILARLDVDTTYSVWGALDVLEKRVERHPQVRQATIHRELPSKLIVEVEEHDPIALVPGKEGMKAYEETGRALPFDPTRVPTDLPVVGVPDTAVLRLLADLKAENRDMYNRVSEVQLAPNGELRFLLLTTPVRALRTVAAGRFAELSSVVRDLAARGIVPAELDLRFNDQVIARLP